MGIEKALGMLRERLAQPPLVAGSAIEWSEIRHAGAREELGGFVRQYERVRAAVSTRGENGRNGREEEGKRGEAFGHAAGWANATESAYANTHAWQGVKRIPSARWDAVNRECSAVTAG